MIAAARASAAPSLASRTGRNYLSYTQITTYQRCPLKWQFEYLDKRSHERVGASLAFGSAVHAALETHFRALLAGCSTPSPDELLVAFQQAWQAEVARPVQYAQGETVQSLHELAGRLLATFAASPHAIPDGEILGVEEELRRQVIPGLPDVLARIDLIVRTDDALVLRDFKTARSRWSAANQAESASQLLLYREVARPLAEEFGDLPIRLEFVVLTKTKRPAVDTHSVEFDPHALGRTQRVLARVWQAMQAGHVYPNPSAMNCATCPFPQACRAWRG